MAGAVEEIRRWAAKELGYWEQAALEKIASGDILQEADYQELCELWEQDVGLAPKPPNRPRLSFPSDERRDSAPGRTKLLKLFNLRDVNALPNGQEIQFGPQVTLIFGDNGAGKTGYARPLGCAAFARGDRDVLPNAKSLETKQTPRADIAVENNGVAKVIAWHRGTRCPELAGFYVFDDESLRAHLTRSNPINFSPSALGLLRELAAVTDRVRDHIKQAIEPLEAKHNFSHFFPGESTTSKLIAELGPKTSLDDLKPLANLSEEEQARLSNLELEIAREKTEGHAQRLAALRQQSKDLENLLISLEQATNATSDETAAKAQKLIEDLAARSVDAARWSADQFKSEKLKQVGTTEWFRFITAARKLAQAEEQGRAPYPQQGDQCLLCRQPLSEEATALVRHIWDLLSSDAQTRLQQSRTECETMAKELEHVHLSYFTEESNVRRSLEREIPTAVPSLAAHNEACTERVNTMVTALRSGEWKTLTPPIAIDTTEIRRALELRRAEATKIEESKPEERLRAAEEALRELKHRRTLGENLEQIEKYVLGRKRAHEARRNLGTTTHITRKHRQLFDSLVTEKYRKTFQNTLREFGSGIRVILDVRGQKGETARQIALNPDAFASQPPIGSILSEGEKRAVALADFLTEASLDESGDGIILDDPVTSLDSKWKEALAKLLASYAKKRQVVVFTHDLVFLYHTKEHAQSIGVSVDAHWIRPEGGRPGFAYTGNSPACEGDYKTATRARDLYARAKNLPPADQQAVLQQGFGALRTSYEALVIFGLFNNVVARFKERISFERLNKAFLAPDIVHDIIERTGAISTQIEAHLHSDEYRPTKPDPSDLLKEILEFERIKKRVKAGNGQQEEGHQQTSPKETTTPTEDHPEDAKSP